MRVVAWLAASHCTLNKSLLASSSACCIPSLNESTLYTAVCTTGGVLTEADIDALLRDLEQQVLHEIQAELAELEVLETEQQQHATTMAEQYLHDAARGA